MSTRINANEDLSMLFNDTRLRLENKLYSIFEEVFEN